MNDDMNTAPMGDEENADTTPAMPTNDTPADDNVDAGGDVDNDEVVEETPAPVAPIEETPAEETPAAVPEAAPEAPAEEAPADDVGGEENPM